MLPSPSPLHLLHRSVRPLLRRSIHSQLGGYISLTSHSLHTHSRVLHQQASRFTLPRSPHSRSMASPPAGRDEKAMTFLAGPRATAIDKELMSDRVGYTLDQLMELAGLSCAQAIEHFYPDRQRVLVVCGPGNNGGDGLVCARHLSLFGYSPTVLYPKEPKTDGYKRLLQQLRTFDIPIVDTFPDSSFPLIVDAIFGFSFDPKNGVREPYKAIIERMVSLQSHSSIVSIDVPSGWDVSAGDVSGTGLRPALLISLTAPKECARSFQGRHALGGRFMPPALLRKLNIQSPPYTGAAQFVDITQPQQTPAADAAAKPKEQA